MSFQKKKSRDTLFDSDCGVSTYQDMDNLFQQYCKEASNNSASHRLYRKQTTKLYASTSVAPKNPSVMVHTARQNDFSPLKKSVDPNFQSDSDLNRKSNLKSNGEHKSSRTNIKVQMNGVQADSNQTLEIYTSADKEGSRDLVIDSLKRTVSQELQDLKKKHSLKLNQAKKFDHNFQNMKRKAKNDKVDIFEWLRVNTQFGALKKKLRARIMEAINNTDPTKISNALERLPQTHETTTIEQENSKILLDNIPQSNNLEIMSKILNEDKSRLNPSPRKIQEKMGGRLFSARNSSSQGLPIKRSGSIFAAESSSEKNRNDFNLHENRVDLSSENKKENVYEWSISKESFFSEYRGDAKNRLSSNIKSSNWNELGFYPLVQEFLISDKSKPERDAILAKYMNGDLLTTQEFKFLADTSATINSHVDKKYLQKIVNNLDSNVVEAFEIELAENILDEYKNVKKNIQDSRQRFLTEKNEERIKRIEQNEKNFHDNIRLQLEQEEQRRTKKKITKFFERLEHNKHRLQEIKNTMTELSHISAGFQEGSQIDDTNNLINTPGYLQDFVQRPHSARSGDIEASKHYYHPSSKLALTSRSEEQDFLGLPPHFTEFTYDEPSKTNANTKPFKISIRSPPSRKMKSKFRNFYSGGPGPDLEVFEGNSINNNASMQQIVNLDKKVVEKIPMQAIWKGEKQKKLFIEMMRKKEEDLRETAKLKNPPNHFSLNLKQSTTFSKGSDNLSDVTRNQSITKSPKNLACLYRTSSSLSNVYEGSDYCLSPARQKRSTKLFKHLSNNMNSPENIYEENIHSSKSKKVTILVSEKRPESRINLKEDTQKTLNNCVSPTLKKLTFNFSNCETLEEEQQILHSARVQIESKSIKTEQSSPPTLKQKKLFSAAKDNNLNLIISLRLSEADVNQKDPSQNTPLYYAAKNGYKEVAEFLIRCGAKINERCSNGNTPLHMAFASDQVMIVMFLLSKGGNLTILNDHNQVPAACGSANLLNLLNLQDTDKSNERKRSFKSNTKVIKMEK